MEYYVIDLRKTICVGIIGISYIQENINELRHISDKAYSWLQQSATQVIRYGSGLAICCAGCAMHKGPGSYRAPVTEGVSGCERSLFLL